MQNRRWVRPLLAFVITFGLLAMTASVPRVLTVMLLKAGVSSSVRAGAAMPGLTMRRKGELRMGREATVMLTV